MKKCNKYLDFVNSDEFDETKNNREYEDILAHCQNCSDCSYDKKIRENIIFNLQINNDIKYPSNLHEIAINSAFDNNSKIYDDSDYIGDFLIKLLKPLEIAVPIASIFILIIMIQLNSNDELIINSQNNKTTHLQRIKIAEASKNINDDGLQKVSSEEVKDFLNKLDEFQKMHPESITNKNKFNFKLVSDR